MGNLIDTFRKQGGTKLIKEYWNAGVLFDAILLLPLLGKSKTALELLRNCITLKVNRKLNKKYRSSLKAFDVDWKPSATIKQTRRVWVCWMQGIEQAPALVQRCYRSLQEHITDREIVLLSEENLSQYVELPEHIMDKYQRGIITRTHFSDLLRVELLCQYGGTWIDATVFCMDQEIPSYMLDSDLFLFQKLKPGADGAAVRVSSWFMTAAPQQKILMAVRHLLYDYWQREDQLIDYFLLHHFLMMASDYYAYDWKKMIQFPNSFPHVLLLMFFEHFDQKKWDALRMTCPIQKLSYKFSDSDLAKPDTYYQHILKG